MYVFEVWEMWKWLIVFELRIRCCNAWLGYNNEHATKILFCVVFSTNGGYLKYN